ncbi:MAG: Cell division protein FtsI [Peptidoglycan synthetase] [uncultured Sphingosinicella sp.]|uniref:Cell division protein FtsI [Peptidoglycan synthetase] n=1 Tax=uncultured Sphingosinicella sp. TaxID=478748 RepID=A0A6J4U811_9SPHN|nr:penicillin-binding protein 2 [uncultured Sphingosinicella sp.]CAA9543121.1 MAG: Cell division protein FtsI [Peptidoglycan synthetase] [uncultured Sphingosinicella sp.]
MTTLAAKANARRVKAPAQKPDALALTYHRLMLMMLVFAGVTALIVGRLMFLQLSTDRGGSGAAVNPLLPARADLVDRNGVTLASTISGWSIGVHPKKLIGNRAELALKLAALMPERSAAEYQRMLHSKKTFVYLKRRALPELVTAVNALGEPGIAFDREPERLYPNLGLAAHIIGYTNLDGRGEAGMERALDARLIREDMRDKPVALSLDSKVQHALEAELLGAMTKFSAVGAAGIIMDIHTGEIMAMTSLPELNPNAPGKGSDDQRFNRATLGVYELGSTFKPFTVAMAMDDGHVKSLGQMYPCPGALKAGRFSITDTHPFGRNCSVAEIMKESSNIGTAQIAAQIGGARQKSYLEQMAFLEPVSVELKERGRPLSPGANWGEIATMTVGFGHGIAVTPLHLATGYATLLNGGIWRPATLLKVDKNRPAPKGRRVFSEDTSYKMRALLRLVVTHGTGKKADAPGYRIGGKTGSAEKYHNRSLLVTTFAGVFPMDDPRYVIVAMLDEPKGISETHGFRTAGWNVAGVVSKTISRIAPVLGVVPDSRRDANLAEVLPYVQAEKKH